MQNIRVAEPSQGEASRKMYFQMMRHLSDSVNQMLTGQKSGKDIFLMPTCQRNRQMHQQGEQPEQISIDERELVSTPA